MKNKRRFLRLKSEIFKIRKSWENENTRIEQRRIHKKKKNAKNECKLQLKINIGTEKVGVNIMQTRIEPSYLDFRSNVSIFISKSFTITAYVYLLKYLSSQDKK